MNAVSDQSDLSLLQEFASRRSQEAFTELTVRHVDWVYSAALRRVGDRHLAEDVTQAVFLLMAQRVDRLSPPLNGWLFKVTCYASANVRRAKARREAYERRAAMLKTEIQEPQADSMWDEISPMLDGLMGRLRAKDRDALLLRFYQRKSVAEVADALGISEDAAKIRIRRAIDRLRDMFSWQGVAVPAAALGAAMISRTTQAAPVGIVIAHSSASASASAVAILKSATIRFAGYKLKLIAAMLLISALIPAGFMTGRMFWKSGDTSPSMQVLQANAPDAPPAKSQLSSAIAPSTGIETDEQALAPFLNSHTDAVYSLDIASMDMDAIDRARSRVLDKFAAGSERWDRDYRGRTGHTQAFSPELTPIYKKWLGGLQKAGVSKFYFISQPGGTDGAPGGAALIIPLTARVEQENVLKFFADLPLRPQIIRGSIVFASERIERDIETRPEEPRPDLLAALASVHGGLRRVISVPMVRHAPPPGNFAGLIADIRDGVFFRDRIWNNVTWVAEGITPPPNEACSFAIKCTSPAGAADMALDLKSRISRFQTRAPLRDGSEEDSRLLAAMRNISVVNDQITASVDADSLDQIIFGESEITLLFDAPPNR